VVVSHLFGWDVIPARNRQLRQYNPERLKTFFWFQFLCHLCLNVARQMRVFLCPSRPAKLA
jgi:hypothetical protein